MIIVNDFANDVFNRVMEGALELVSLSTKSTLTSREVQTSVRLVLPGELAKHAVSEGTKAVCKFASSADPSSFSAPITPTPKNKKAKVKRMTKSQKVGLVFPIGKVHTLMKTKHSGNIGQTASVYLAAVMEYMVAEVLELSGNAARDMKLQRITPHHVMLAIRGDEELDTFVGVTWVSHGGVLPHIHKALLNNKAVVVVLFYH